MERRVALAERVKSSESQRILLTSLITLFQDFLEDHEELKKSLQLQNNREETICPEWIAKAKVQEFLQYGETQMWELISTGQLLSTKVGRRIFIHRDSLKALLDNNAAK